MHLNYEDILRFIDHKLEKDKMEYANKHLSDCEYCLELYNQITLTSKKYNEFLNQDYSEELKLINEKFKYHQPRANIILLQLLPKICADDFPYLAADGIQEENLPIQIISTFISEDPEIVVKLIKDAKLDEEYLLVLSENEENMSNVLIELPQLNRHFMTDKKGKAIIQNLDIDSLSNEKWQVKLPDAVFKLEPFDYNPDKTEETTEVILTTKNNDKLKINFEEKTEGHFLQIQLLELNGKVDIDDIKISLIQDDQIYIEKANSHSVVSFNLKEGSDGINIRIFS